MIKVGGARTGSTPKGAGNTCVQEYEGRDLRDVLRRRRSNVPTLFRDMAGASGYVWGARQRQHWLEVRGNSQSSSWNAWMQQVTPFGSALARGPFLLPACTGIFGVTRLSMRRILRETLMTNPQRPASRRKRGSFGNSQPRVLSRGPLRNFFLT